VINVKIRNHYAWFKDLASHKALSQLCKTKVPVFSKKEDIFQVNTGTFVTVASQSLLNLQV